MKNRLTAALAIAGCSVFLLAGCSNSSGAAGMGGMDHPGSGMSSTAPAGSSSSHNPQDVSFARGMAMHHQQAIEMAEIVLGKQGVDTKVRTLATEIKSAQQPEIEQMTGWLKSWGEQTVTGPTSGMGSMGGGMMSQDDMGALDSASGTKASALFLTQMTAHHKGAIEMARTEVAKGKNLDAVALAKKIIADQTTQITQMRDLRTQL